MADRVLVAHAGKYGSTAEIAEAVAASLADGGLDVDCRPAKEVRTLDSYGAVVLGSAVYVGRWRRPAMRLLRRLQRDPGGRDVWLFSSGPVGEADVDDPAAQRWLRPAAVERLATEIGVHDHAVFGGRVAEDGGPMRRKMAQDTPEDLRDLRDWDEVTAWAHGVAAALRTDAPAPDADRP